MSSLDDAIGKLLDQAAERAGQRFIVQLTVSVDDGGTVHTLPAAVGPFEHWTDAMEVAERMDGHVVPLTSVEALDAYHRLPD